MLVHLLWPLPASPERTREEDLMPLILVAILTLSLLYWFAVRRWMSRWGATPSDLTRIMAGDALLSDPTYSGTLAVIVNAAPEQIWP
jgi:hypothetical protein